MPAECVYSSAGAPHCGTARNDRLRYDRSTIEDIGIYETSRYSFKLTSPAAFDFSRLCTSNCLTTLPIPSIATIPQRFDASGQLCPLPCASSLCLLSSSWSFFRSARFSPPCCFLDDRSQNRLHHTILTPQQPHADVCQAGESGCRRHRREVSHMKHASRTQGQYRDFFFRERQPQAATAARAIEG